MKPISRELETGGLPQSTAEALEPLKLMMRDLDTLLNRGLGPDNLASERVLVTISAGQQYPLLVRVEAQERPAGVRVVAVEAPLGTTAAVSAAPWVRWGFAPGQLSILERPLGLAQGTAYSVRLDLEVAA